MVAEGVEDDATLRILADLRADTAQGDYFSRPLPPADLAAWLRLTGLGRFVAEATARGLIRAHLRGRAARRRCCSTSIVPADEEPPTLRPSVSACPLCGHRSFQVEEERTKTRWGVENRVKTLLRCNGCR